MKNFNQMTEVQMSKTNGGELALLIGSILALVFGTVTGVGLGIRSK